jgi:hypothetical protein
LPDKISSGNSFGLRDITMNNNGINKNMKKDNHENNFYNKELDSEKYLIDINNSYYIEYINYLNNFDFNFV